MSFLQYVLGAWVVVLLTGVSGLCLWSAIWAPPTPQALWTGWLVYRTGQALLVLALVAIAAFILALFVVALLSTLLPGPAGHLTMLRGTAWS